MSHDVFVSYSSKDKAVADSIVAELEKYNVRCWYAPRDIKPGDDWGVAIAQAISDSKIFLIVFSNNSNRSQRVLDELNLAISKEVVILPFRIEKLDPSGAMLLHLASRHWLDAFSPSWKPHLITLVNTVKSILDKKSETDFEKDAKNAHTPFLRKKWGFISVIAAFVVIGLVLGVLAFRNGWFDLKHSAEPTVMMTATPAITVAPTNTQILPTQTSTATATATPSIGSSMVSPVDGMTMVYVPEGEFTMGITNGPLEMEGPAHQVYLDAYWIDKTEVTIGMYNLCVSSGYCRPIVLEGSDRNPVTNAAWEEARTYCEWAGRRLPTEAEWEKAAKGNNNFKFPWGNSDATLDRVYFGEQPGTLPVGSLPLGASPYGALDMAGNAWEWVADWFAQYSSDFQDNPTGPVEGKYKILRGGSSGTWEILLRTTYRHKVDPLSYLLDDVNWSIYPLGGFRCAQSE